MTEAFLGDTVRFQSLVTGVGCSVGDDDAIGCCSLGARLLVMAGCNPELFAVLVDLDAGELSETSVHITVLHPEADIRWLHWPYLCGTSERQALLYFNMHDEGWLCTVADTSLYLTRMQTRFPVSGGFATVPTRLPDGRLIAAGSWPDSKDITVITVGEDLAFERVGTIPGVERDSASTILIGERFLVNTGGWRMAYLDDFWIFDTQTRKGCQVRKEGAWHPADDWVVTAVKDNTLYLIGGENTRSVTSISLEDLAPLIVDGTIRSAFCMTLGIHFSPRSSLTARVIGSFVPTVL